MTNINALSNNSPKSVILESYGTREELMDSGAYTLIEQMRAKGGFSITPVPTLDNLSDLMAQCSAQPGLSSVLFDITTQSDGKELYLQARNQSYCSSFFTLSLALFIPSPACPMTPLRISLVSWAAHLARPVVCSMAPH